jgi:protein tyrosine phosphatase (PTP) superfamily phosphohydrolase (DUF442 family)
MASKQWLRVGGPRRGAPARVVQSRASRVGLIALALFGLAMEGCRSFGNGCSTCGLRQRLFPRRAAAAGCCGEPALGPGVIEPAPGAVVTPGAVVAPPPPGPGVVPAPAGTIEDLQPIPPASGSSGGGSGSQGTPGATSGTTGAGRASYDAYRPSYPTNSSRGPNLARSLLPAEPASRSARRPVPDSRDNTFDEDLPPLTLPQEPASGAASPPAAPGAKPQASLPEEAKDQTSPASQASNSSAPRPQAEPAPAEAEASVAGVTVAPIPHFQALEPSVAGGALPSLDGLNWLQEKGYKTLLDLREPGDGSAAYMAEVTKRGLRYLPLPVNATALDADQLKRFNEEIEHTDARPIYFCDTDGQRAGALWYLRRLTVEKVKVDEATAAEEAKSLGLTDQTIWSSVHALIERLQGTKVPSPPRPAETPKADTPSAPSSPPPQSATTDLPGVELAAAPGPKNPPRACPAVHDPAGWRPFVALLLAGLGIPLAYWGRAGFNLGCWVRASLPGVARRLKSLPAASDVRN